MKKSIKILCSLIFIFAIFCIFNIVKSNSISRIDMDIYVDNSGNATITEVWDCSASKGTEVYHPYYNLGNSKITDFKVSMDNVPLTEKNWDINENLEQKRGYYGTNTIEDGIELCFGK